MQIQRLIGATAVLVISTCAMVVSANDCFVNVARNTCQQMAPLFPSGADCVKPQNNNSCNVGVSSPSGVDQIGSPTDATCVFKYGSFDGEECLTDGFPEQTVTVQCSPAVGQACDGGDPDSATD